MQNIIVVFICVLLTGCISVNNTDEPPEISWPSVVEATDGEKGEGTAGDTESTTNKSTWVNGYTISVDVNPVSRIVIGDLKLSYKNETGDVLNELCFNVYLNAFDRNAEVTPYFSAFKTKIFPDDVIDYGYMQIIDVISQNKELEYTLESSLLTVKLNEPLEPDSELELSMRFDSYIPLINHRTGANENAMWFGNFFPILAVYDEDGWRKDSYYPAGAPFYSTISNYNVTITTPVGYTVVATGGGEISESDGKRVTSVSVKMVRDFAFAVSDKYSLKITKTASNKYINLYTYSDSVDKDALLEAAVKSINYYTNLAGSYPSSSLDIAEIGFFASGGMEYPLIVFIDSNYLNDGAPYYSVAHEIGHQWFYGLVGNDQIRESWLSEGLTSLLQLYIFFSEAEIMKMIQNDYESLAESLESAEHTSLRTDLSVFGSWREYSQIHYTKAKLMLYSLRLKIGADKFNELVRAYCTKYSYGIASTQNFIATAEEVYGSNLSDFFDAWLSDAPLPPLE